jgi:hypothetical protein
VEFFGQSGRLMLDQDPASEPEYAGNSILRGARAGA